MCSWGSRIVLHAGAGPLEMEADGGRRPKSLSHRDKVKIRLGLASSTQDEVRRDHHGYKTRLEAGGYKTRLEAEGHMAD